MWLTGTILRDVLQGADSPEQVIKELIKQAKDLDAATKAGKEMGLTDDEKAFYDALAANESAVAAMGDDKLKLIASELITQVERSVTIDWTLRKNARAKIKVMVKRILKTRLPAGLTGRCCDDRARAGGVVVHRLGGGRLIVLFGTSSRTARAREHDPANIGRLDRYYGSIVVETVRQARHDPEARAD